MEPSSIFSSDPRTIPGIGRLLVKLLLFLTGGALLLSPLCMASLRADRAVFSSSVFQAGPRTTLVVAGDSHTETAINPGMIPGAINISRSAENYFYTYYKLKHFLEQNPQVKVVMLGYSPHTIMNHDAQFYEDRANRWKDYFLLIDAPARRELASPRLPYLVALLQAEYGVPFRLFQNTVLMKYILGRTTYTRMDIPFSGDYKPLQGTYLNPEKVAKRAKEHFWNEDRYAGTSPVMIGYLKKTVSLCRERGVELVLLDTPVTATYRELIPAQAVDDCRRIRDGLLREYPNVRYCDLGGLDLRTEDFFDGNHVNSSGAKIVTAALTERCGRFLPIQGKVNGNSRH